jgi:RNA polymerase sigma factor (sigma-70 family)
MDARARLDPALVERLHTRAEAGRWQVSLDRFEEALIASLAKAEGDGPLDHREVERYVVGLHLSDLALATACADGHAPAWDHFVLEVRPVLYRAADALDPSGGAREVADGLYGELYGLSASGVARPSLFRYFHGRSSLATWVRAVLSQRLVDRARSLRRIESLPDEDSSASPVAAGTVVDPEHDRWMRITHRALAEAIAALAPADRLRLGCYYAQSLTLAAIGRMFGEHEATASRHLTRIRRDLRADVERRLRTDHHLTPEALSECLAAAAGDAGTLNVSQLLAADAAERKETEASRSTAKGGRRVERA